VAAQHCRMIYAWEHLRVRGLYGAELTPPLSAPVSLFMIHLPRFGAGKKAREGGD
jgi:hypothetical protein